MKRGMIARSEKWSDSFQTRGNKIFFTNIWRDRDTVVLSGRKAEDARAELDGRQRLLAELEAKTSHLKERAKSLDVELDLINR